MFYNDIRSFSCLQFQYILLFSRQGKLRLQRWYTAMSQKDKRKITRELISIVLARKPKMCSFLEYRDLKIVYKRLVFTCCKLYTSYKWKRIEIVWKNWLLFLSFIFFMFHPNYTGKKTLDWTVMIFVMKIFVLTENCNTGIIDFFTFVKMSSKF